MSGNLHFSLKCVPRVHQKGYVAGGSEESFSLDSRAAALHRPQHVLLTWSPRSRAMQQPCVPIVSVVRFRKI